MEMKSLIEARVLIVDDRPDVLEDTEEYLKEIDDLEKAGIAKFDIEKADSLGNALRILHKNIETPFNIILLDLDFENEREIPPEIKNIKILDEDYDYIGFTVLRFIQMTGSAEYIIIVSAHPEENTRKAFRLGASDFLVQPCGSQELQERFLICWSRLISGKSQRILDRRISDLVPYAEKGLAYQFTSYFSSLAQESVDYVEDIERYLQERFGLERQKDADDFFFKRSKEQTDYVAKLKKSCEELQNSVLSTGKSRKEVTVKNVIKDVHRKLLSCLVVKNIWLEFRDNTSAPILSLEDKQGDDVSAVFQEIISGALADLPDHNEKEFINIEVEDISGQVKVRFSDNLKSISKEDARNINKGLNISTENRFGREWGLSVVQHIAIRGGGRLEIEPQASGNVITYYIPTT